MPAKKTEETPVEAPEVSQEKATFQSKKRGVDYNIQSRLISLRKNEAPSYLGASYINDWFQKDNPSFSVVILEKVVDMEKGFAMFVVEVTDADGNTVQDIGTETREDFKDFPEKAYTKSVRRAKEQLGYSTEGGLESEVGPVSTGSSGYSDRNVPQGVISAEQVKLLNTKLQQIGWSIEDEKFNQWLQEKVRVKTVSAIPAQNFQAVINVVDSWIQKYQSKQQKEEEPATPPTTTETPATAETQEEFPFYEES